jgi:hypothetical protein
MGRIAATILLIVPVLFAVFVNVFFLIAAALWVIFIVPIGARDVWRRVRTNEALQPVLVIAPEPAPLPEGTSILDRPAPPRW